RQGRCGGPDLSASALGRASERRTRQRKMSPSLIACPLSSSTSSRGLLSHVRKLCITHAEPPAFRRSSTLLSASHAARCVACHGVRSHAVPVALVGECSPVV